MAPFPGGHFFATCLSSLKSVLETGKPLVVKMSPPARMLAALKELGIAVL